MEIIEDLLIEFDEMAFIPMTTCPDPDGFARAWKEKLTKEIVRMNNELEMLRDVKAVYMNVDHCASDLKDALEENDRLKKRIEELEVMLKHGDPYARGFADGVRASNEGKEESL